MNKTNKPKKSHIKEKDDVEKISLDKWKIGRKNFP